MYKARLDFLEVPAPREIVRGRVVETPVYRLVLVIPKLTEFNPSSADAVLLLDPTSSSAELLWKISIEVRTPGLIYLADIGDPSKPIDRLVQPLTAKDILIGSGKWGFVTENTAPGGITQPKRYAVLSVSSEEARLKMQSIASKLAKETIELNTLRNKIKLMDRMTVSKIGYKHAFIITIASLQLSAVAFLALAIGWDLAEPVSFIISQLNLAWWLLIFLVTGTLPYKSLRDHYADKHTKEIQRLEIFNIHSVLPLYKRCWALTEALYRYRKIFGVRFR